MYDEMNSLKINEVWDLVELPIGKIVVGCRWFYKIKCDFNVDIEKYEFRLVTQDYNRKEVIDYTKIFYPISIKYSFHIIMDIIARFDLELHHMDAKTTFLNGALYEDVLRNRKRAFGLETQKVNL